jgi:hypothetical protein
MFGIIRVEGTRGGYNGVWLGGGGDGGDRELTSGEGIKNNLNNLYR